MSYLTIALLMGWLTFMAVPPTFNPFAFWV